MIKIDFCGQTFDCCEHMVEIKKEFDGSLLDRFYNKKQMFKALLGKVYRYYYDEGLTNYDITTEEGDYGNYCTQIIKTGNQDEFIEIYRIEDLKTDADFISELSFCIGNGWFFVKDDNGQIYLFVTDCD